MIDSNDINKSFYNFESFYLVSVSYDGSFFSGWAIQPKIFTVQGFIEEKISSIFNSKISILSSSRTDKGVHAIDQKFVFKTSLNLSNEKLKKILNRSLRKFVDVKNVKKVTSNFHPIYNVLSKEYRYYINTGEYNIFLKKYCWNFNKPINIIKLREILSIFEGHHNFFNFSYCRKKDKEKKNTFRKIEKISVSKRESLIVIRVLAKGFLRYQIRAIIGESINFLWNKKDVKNLKKMLLADVDDKYKSIAPSSGLYLWNVIFHK